MWRRVAAVSAAAAVLATAIVGGAAAPAQAADGRAFDPGYIISDAQFYNPNAMSEAEIQAFLASRVNPQGGCLNDLCLAAHRLVTPNRAASYASNGRGLYCSAYAGSSNESAAAVIFKVQRACGISAKVILVTLQKEQGLITNRAPSLLRLERAMGYACPDNNGGVCSSNFYGFFNQVYAAAKQLVTYKVYPFGYFQPGVKNVQWSPSASCGSSQITIRNDATAALYNYTPYRPNGAALANVYGTGDACSAYGNRNFWRDYSDWFGSPTGGIDGGFAMTEAYRASGGEGGPLGRAAMALNCAPGRLLCWQRFEKGYITWAHPRQAFVSAGEIGAFYRSSGGPDGSLGYADSTMVTSPANGGGVAQAFRNGVVNSSPAGTFLETGKIRAAHNAAGSVAGVLGWPRTARGCTSPRGGCSQGFQGGTVYEPQSGAAQAVLRGPMLTAYAAVGGPGGVLGYPTSRQVNVTANGGGSAQSYEAGLFNVGPEGAFLSTGGVRAAHSAAGGVGGPVGWPTGPQTCGLARGGCSQPFQNGTVVVDGAGVGGVIVNPAIKERWNRPGAAEALGYPVSRDVPVSANGGGSAQAFQDGLLNAGPRGAFKVVGVIRTKHAAAGGVAGSLGWPIAEQVCGQPDGGCTQRFQNGTLSTVG